MFKDVFVLKRSSYHAKMMKYVWNLNPNDFSHMCPYWWLSVFNHIIFIPYFGIRFTLKYVGKFFKWVDNFIIAAVDSYDDYLERVENENIQKAIDYYVKHPEELVDVPEKKWKKIKYMAFGETYNFLTRQREKRIDEISYKKRLAKEEEQEEERKKEFLKVCDLPDKEEMIDGNDYIDYMSNKLRMDRLRESEINKQRIIRNKERINKILKVVKPILTGLAYFVGSVVVLVALYYGFKGISYVAIGVSKIKHESWVKVGKTTGYVGSIFIGFLIAISIVYLLIKLMVKINLQGNSKIKKIKIPTKGLTKKLKLIFSPLVWVWKNIFVKIVKSIKNCVYFLIQMIKNECPAIKWED